VAAFTFVKIVPIEKIKKKRSIKIIDISKEIPQSKNKTRRPLNKITHVGVHHTGIKDKKQNGLTIANYHVKEKEQTTAGYHYIIYPNGNIEKLNDLNIVAPACKGSNTISLNVAFIGNYDMEKLTRAQKKSFKNLFLYLDSKTPNDLNIYTHGEKRNTKCPGTDVKKYIKELKNNLNL